MNISNQIKKALTQSRTETKIHWEHVWRASQVWYFDVWYA